MIDVVVVACEAVSGRESGSPGLRVRNKGRVADISRFGRCWLVNLWQRQTELTGILASHRWDRHRDGLGDFGREQFQVHDCRARFDDGAGCRFCDISAGEDEPVEIQITS